MNRKPFKPIQGNTYTNRGDANAKYLCIQDCDLSIMQNVSSGWTFIAHGVGIYEDGTIDWDYSTGGHFRK